MSIDDVLKKYGPESEPTSMPKSGVDAILARYPETRKPRKPWYAGIGTAIETTRAVTPGLPPPSWARAGGTAELKVGIEGIEPAVTRGMSKVMAVYQRQMERAGRVPVIGSMARLAERERVGVEDVNTLIAAGFALADYAGKKGMTKLAEAITQQTIRGKMRPESVTELAGLLVGRPIEEPRLPMIGKLTSPVNLAFIAAGGLEAMRHGDIAEATRIRAKAAQRRAAKMEAATGAAERLRAGGFRPTPTGVQPEALGLPPGTPMEALPARQVGPVAAKTLTEALKVVRETKARELVETVGQEQKPELYKEVRRLLGKVEKAEKKAKPGVPTRQLRTIPGYGEETFRRGLGARVIPPEVPGPEPVTAGPSIPVPVEAPRVIEAPVGTREAILGSERGAIRAGLPSRAERVAARLGKTEAEVRRIEAEIQGESRGATQPTVKQVEFLRRFIRATEQAVERGAPSGVKDVLKTLREERGEFTLSPWMAGRIAREKGLTAPKIEKVVERLKKAQKEAGPQPLPGGPKKPPTDIERVVTWLRSEKGAVGGGGRSERAIRIAMKEGGLSEVEARTALNALKREAKALEAEKWLTPSQARGIKRAVTAQELEGLTKGEVSQAQVNKLIRMLRTRAKTGAAQKIIEKRTGARTIGKEVSFEDRKLIASDLLQGIPEGHRPNLLAKALGKASMKEMGPEEIAGYIEKLKRIPGMERLNPVEMLMGSPYRIWPQLGEKAYEAQRLTRQFLESVDTRAREAMKPMKGAMTDERRGAIFDAIEHTLRTDQPLTPQLLKRIGEGAEPFVKFARELGDELFGMMKAVNPSMKYRYGHILHYWKRTGFIDKLLGPKKGELKPWETRFEQMPEGLPVGTTIRTAGEMPRKGAPGFVRDPFEALRAETARVAFKVHWEPVLRDFRAAIAEAPPTHKMALEQWMGSLKGREGTTDWAVRNGLQWIYDNVGLKRQAPYKPLTRGGRNLVALRYNAVLSMNPGPIVKNFFQRINTFAEFGDEPRAYARGLRKALTGERLKLAKEHGVIEDFEARELLQSFRAGVLAKLQSAGMKGFTLMERWNRAEAFSIGYEWGLAKGMTPEMAVKAGLKGVADTQFLYGKIGMPAAFRNPVGRVLLQLGSWPVKQSEWALRHASEAIKAGQVGDTKEALRHWGVLGRYAMLNAGIIVAAEKAGLDVRDFLGLGQFDFRNPMWLKTLWTAKNLPTSPVARYEFLRELKTSWPPAGVAISKAVKVVSAPTTPSQKVLAVLSVRTKEKGQLSRLYVQRKRLQERQEVFGRERRAGKEVDRRAERYVRIDLRRINRDIEELQSETGKPRGR